MIDRYSCMLTRSALDQYKKRLIRRWSVGLLQPFACHQCGSIALDFCAREGKREFICCPCTDFHDRCEMIRGSAKNIDKSRRSRWREMTEPKNLSALSAVGAESHDARKRSINNKRYAVACSRQFENGGGACAHESN